MYHPNPHGVKEWGGYDPPSSYGRAAHDANDVPISTRWSAAGCCSLQPRTYNLNGVLKYPLHFFWNLPAYVDDTRLGVGYEGCKHVCFLATRQVSVYTGGVLRGFTEHPVV